MDVYLIRHTEVALKERVAYGQSDIDLADTYEEQRDRLITHLPDDPMAIFSSPLRRCRQLADDLSHNFSPGSQIEIAPGQKKTIDSHPLPVQTDDRLKEFFFGEWEMVPWNDIDRSTLDSWMADFVTIRTPNGENFSDLFERVRDFWQSSIMPLAQSKSTQPVFIVSHGGVIRALLCLFLDLSLQNAYRINLDYGAVTKLTVNGSFYTVQYINR